MHDIVLVGSARFADLHGGLVKYFGTARDRLRMERLTAMKGEKG
jgi:hypothetical protein